MQFPFWVVTHINSADIYIYIVAIAEPKPFPLHLWLTFITTPNFFSLSPSHVWYNFYKLSAMNILIQLLDNWD